MREPKQDPTSDTVLFNKIEANVGNHYNVTTGKFLCDKAGIYYFSAALFSKQNEYCFIRKNGSSVLVVSENKYVNGTSISYVFYPGTSVVVYLNLGDVMDLGGCTHAETLNQQSSFAGFLLLNTD